MDRLIGLYSPAPQSGKTTVAEAMVSHGYQRIPFAAPLKRMASAFLQSLGYSHNEAERLVQVDKEATIPSLGVTVRHVLQTLGTEWGRTCIAPDVWLACWQASATSHPLVVVDDVRFPNEADLIRDMGGELWCIWRPGLDDATGHASEGALQHCRFDRYIANAGTVEELIRDLF